MKEGQEKELFVCNFFNNKSIQRTMIDSLRGKGATIILL